MTFEQFQASLKYETPPAGCNDYLKALWHDGKDDWNASHNIAQDIPTREGDWVHAYLHRRRATNGMQAIGTDGQGGRCPAMVWKRNGKQW